MPSVKLIVAEVFGRLAATTARIFSRARSSCSRERNRMSPSTTTVRGTTLVLPVADPENVGGSNFTSVPPTITLGLKVRYGSRSSL